MGYLKYPTDLTEEELMLQAKYAVLRKKKKALQDLKTPNPEPQRVQQAAKTKCPSEAREEAKKLLKSGAIAAIKTPKRPEESFKRSRGLDKKLTSTERKVSSYQPFSPPKKEEPETKKPKITKLSESFVPSSDPAEKPVCKPKSIPSEGHTIFVYTRKLSEEYLREHFEAFGNIIRITIEKGRKGFVTFETAESAREAINQMNGKTVSSFQLKVALAREPFVFNPLTDNPSTSVWGEAATNFDQKDAFRRDEERDLKTYDDNIFD